ncbi:MAG TPA: hypothetical protein VFX79_02860 [Candidatus Saccharimonadales bacterium]|nr:hypothetical protein [Candidatus Saccharimonadales bacterium]
MGNTSDTFGETIEASQERSYERRDAARRARHNKIIRRRQRVLSWTLGSAAAVAVVFGGPRAAEIGLGAIKDSANSAGAYEKKIEGCVSALVGKEVNLVQDPLGPGLQHPRSVIEEQRACERSEGDPAVASTDIQPIPLASAGGQ